MSEAMDEVGLEGKFREIFFQRLVMTAHHMVNEQDSEEELE
jgi:hemoglobin